MSLSNQNKSAISSAVIEVVGENIDIFDVYSEDQVKQAVRDRYKPSDVFADDDLEDWALNIGGLVKPSE